VRLGKDKARTVRRHGRELIVALALAAALVLFVSAQSAAAGSPSTPVAAAVPLNAALFGVFNGSFTTNTAISVSGTPTVGTAFTAAAGSYSPTPTSTSYQWEQCDSGGASCANISGATAISYTPVAGDVGHTLKVIETVSKAGYDNGSSSSSASGVVTSGSFSITSLVTINGQPTVGTTLTITNGVYSPTAATRSDQWETCDSSGNNCSNIGGATSNTYTPVAGDVGSTLRVVQTVTRDGYNNGGSTSDASSAVIEGTFTTSTAVAINGTPTVGMASALTPGSYSPTPSSSAYQWRLCDSAGNNCSDIGGATTDTYTPVAGDVGSTLRVVETVSESGYNDASSTSDGGMVVVAGPITTSAAVAIHGTPTVAVPSALTRGTYAPTPAGRSYQWEKCDSAGANCSNIGGATANTYTPVAGDVGSALRVVETVRKAGYSTGTSMSAPSAIVVNGSFSTHTAVAINGTPTVAATSTISVGSYTPAPTSSSYQWESCNSLGGGCSNIGGATSSTYTPVAGDVGSTLRVIETVSASGYNNGGSLSVASPVVMKATFSTTTAVAINGTAKVGTATTIAVGSYSPTPTSRSYQWELCDSSGANCSNIGGATGNTYMPVSGQVGSTLRVVETVSNAGYNGSSTSNAVVVNGIFTTNVAVAINGTPTVGAKSTTTGGTYTPSPTGRSYQWKRCNSSGSSCVAISEATYPTYTPVAADVGRTLRVVETVEASLYVDGESTSAASAVVVKGTFVMNTQVAVFGYPKHGVVSKITQGSYTPTPTSRTYQWQRCTSTSPSSCLTISGATAKTYTPVSADIGERLRVVETVKKSGYHNLSVTSLASTAVT